MENKLSRPASVWIAQVLSVILALLFLLPLVLMLFALIVPVGVPSLAGLIVMIAVNVGMSAVFVAAFVGMARRRQWGRWLSVGMLSMMLFFSIMGQIFRPPGPLPYAEYENSTQAMAGLMTQVVMMGLLLWLILALAFGKRARSFFSGKVTEPTTQILP